MKDVKIIMNSFISNQRSNNDLLIPVKSEWKQFMILLSANEQLSSESQGMYHENTPLDIKTVFLQHQHQSLCEFLLRAAQEDAFYGSSHFWPMILNLTESIKPDENVANASLPRYSVSDLSHVISDEASAGDSKRKETEKEGKSKCFKNESKKDFLMRSKNFSEELQEFPFVINSSSNVDNNSMMQPAILNLMMKTNDETNNYLNLQQTTIQNFDLDKNDKMNGSCRQTIEDSTDLKLEMERFSTRDIAQQVAIELRRYSIPQAVFSRQVLGRSQGTLSDLLRNPKPWSKLKAGRETFCRMWKWLKQPQRDRLKSISSSQYSNNQSLSATVEITSTSVSSSNDLRTSRKSLKKTRLVFTEIQRRTLVAIFKEMKRPSREIQSTIAEQLGLKMSTVTNFFMNARRRSSEKYTEDSRGDDESNKKRSL